MDLFENVKNNVSCREAANRYGLETNPYAMAKCPFHSDRHPSMYVADDHYYCFSCSAHGDVIDLTAKFLGLKPYNAAEKLAEDFEIIPDNSPHDQAGDIRNEKTKAQQLRENERLCFSVMNDYLRLLREWKVKYAPQSPDEIPDDRFVEACRWLDYTAYLMDEFIEGSQIERAELCEMLTGSGTFQYWKSRVDAEKGENESVERSNKNQ